MQPIISPGQQSLLHARQGQAEVDVEFRGSSGGSFGHGKKKAMRFGDFLRQLEAGKEDLYLTTQTVRRHLLPNQNDMDITLRRPGTKVVAL